MNNQCKECGVITAGPDFCKKHRPGNGNVYVQLSSILEKLYYIELAVKEERTEDAYAQIVDLVDYYDNRRLEKLLQYTKGVYNREKESY